MYQIICFWFERRIDVDKEKNDKKKGSNILKKSYLPIIGIVFLILLAVFVLLFNNRHTNQAMESFRSIVRFEGQYRIGEGDWQEIEEGKHISSIKGDVTLKGNHIHHCQHGTWLDWQAQGTRVTKNFYHDNTRCDLMVEVTHGPCTVDNNIFLSDTALVNQAQGTALVNNLIRGIMFASNMLTRATPYHCPHSTLVMGYAAVYGGDDRLYNNIFAGEVQPIKDTPTYSFCGAYYDRYSTECEYIEMLKPGMKYNSLQTYTEIPQPVYIGYNAYSGNAAPFRKEESPVIAVGISTEISENGGEWTLSINVPKELANMQCPQITAEKLGTPRVTCQSYENADGSPLNLKTDYFGITRENTVIPGPFAKLSIGENKITVWSEK